MDVAQSLSVAQNCTLRFTNGGELRLSQGATLTFQEGRQIEAPINQHISYGKGRVAGLTGEVPVEWFGAVGDANLTGAGTDNTAAIQATIDAVVSGNALLGAHYYRTNGTLTIAKPNVGIHGSSQGYGYPGNSPSSLIVNASATADTLDLVTPAVWNTLRDFTVQRSVQPHGEAKGISVDRVGGYVFDQVQSQDSIYDFYLISAPNYGVGNISNTQAGWGYAGIKNYGDTPVYGYYLDSSKGKAENTIIINNAGASNNFVAKNSICMEVSGTAINDVDVDVFGCAGGGRGLNVTSTGAGNTYANQDLHFRNITLDMISGDAIQINNIKASLRGSVTLEDCWLSQEGRGVAVADSSGIVVSDCQFANGAEGFTSTNSSDITLTGNLIFGQKMFGIYVDHVQHSTFTANVLRGGKTLIQARNSPNNTFTGNALGGKALVGVDLDAASKLDFVGNSIDPLIPTPATDASGSIARAGLPSTGVVAGTYTNATVRLDAYGRVTEATSAGGSLRLPYKADTTVDWARAGLQRLRLDGDTTVQFSGAVAGTRYTLEVTQGESGKHKVNWPEDVRWKGGRAPRLTKHAGRSDVIEFLYDGEHYLGETSLNF